MKMRNQLIYDVFNQSVEDPDENITMEDVYEAVSKNDFSVEMEEGGDPQVASYFRYIHNESRKDSTSENP